LLLKERQDQLRESFDEALRSYNATQIRVKFSPEQGLRRAPDYPPSPKAVKNMRIVVLLTAKEKLP
jgi:hypothetical protein